MIEPPPPTRWAACYKNDDFILIETWSGYASARRDPAGEFFVLPPDAPDAALGDALLAALAASRQFHPDEDRAFFDARARMPEHEAWVKNLMDRFGYKTKRKLFNGLLSVTAEQCEGLIILPPTHREGQGWSGTATAPDVVIPETSSPPEVGAALREAFNRCF